MRFVKLSQKEFQEIRKLYESVMSQACCGLFYREGMILGEEITKIAKQEADDYLEICSKLLRARGWIEDIKFESDIVYVTGSIEAGESDNPTCHRLRGIIQKIVEGYSHARKHCEEIECVSKGDKQCVFKLEESGSD